MLVVFRFLCGLCVLFSVVAAPVHASTPLRVFVSIEPLRYLVERVGDERVDVTVVVKGGQQPETYEPTPRQVAALAQADVFFGAGMPLEAAWRRQLRGVAGRSPQWVDLSAGIDGGPAADTEVATQDGQDHAAADPHVWLSPIHARRMATVVSEALTELDPQGAADFERNASTLRGELDLLHRDISSILQGSGVTSFLVFHPAWGHFARAYGLEQIAIESDGKEPGTKAMIEVIRRARQAGLGVVFVDPRHATRPAETIADAIGAEIEVLDPLSTDYPNNLRTAARAIAASAR